MAIKNKTLIGHAPAAKDAQGNLYFGAGNTGRTNGGLDRIYPERYSSAATSSVYLRSLTINQKPFPLSVGVNNLEELSLRYNQNTISIETGIIDYYAKGKGHIRYKLEGNDKMKTGNMVLLIIRSGMKDYRRENINLYLQASNAGNEFNSPEKILMINISPPFWKTWWFRITAVIFIIASIYTFMRWRIQQKFRLNWNDQKKKDKWPN